MEKIGLIFFGDFYTDARCINMVDTFLNSGHKCWIIDINIYGGNEKYKAADIFHIKLDKKKCGITKYPFFYYHAGKILRSLNADIIIAGNLYVLYLLRKLNNVRKIFDSREIYSMGGAALKTKLIKYHFWAYYEKLFIKNMHHVIVTATRDENVINTNYPKIPTSIIYNYPPKYLLPSYNRQLRDRIDISDSQKILLYQGVLHEGRHLKGMVDILKKMKNMTAVIIGNGYLKNSLLKYAELNQVNNRFFIIDAVPYQALLNLTSGADLGWCIIEPLTESLNCALPNKLFEYALAGIPSVVSDLPEMSPIVNKYKLGEIVPTYNIEKQIIAIKLLLAKNRKNDIKKTAIKNFTWDVQSNKFMQIILGHN